jgi:hypothetical protein
MDALYEAVRLIMPDLSPQAKGLKLEQEQERIIGSKGRTIFSALADLLR